MINTGTYKKLKCHLNNIPGNYHCQSRPRQWHSHWQGKKL